MTAPEQLDRDDPLASFRDRFVGSRRRRSSTSTATRSAGRCEATGERLARFVEDEWGGRLIRGWDERWLDLPRTIGDDLGRVCLGAARRPDDRSATRRPCCSTS